MASAVLRPKRERFLDQRSSNESSALRLIGAERPEEIVFLGFPRAAVFDLNFDTGEIKAVASLNFDHAFLSRMQTSLWASEDPLVGALLNLKSVSLSDGSLRPGALYAHPMIYKSGVRCWEAERERRPDCLAVQNADTK